MSRVHFASGPSQNASSPHTPYSQRHSILSKLLPALSNYVVHPSNSHAANHQLDQQLGSLLEVAQFILKPTALHAHPPIKENFVDAERKLMERVVKCQLDPSTDFVIVRELSSSECGKVELVKSRLSKDEGRNQRNVFVLKTIYKSAAIRMRDHVSPRAELAILQLSRTNPPTKPFIPYLRASFQSSDSLHFLTSYVPGGTLADFICSRPRPPLNLENAIRQWAAEMILGLDWLHNTHRWVHRDLKPSNLLLRSDGHVVLSDFGTAAPLVRVEPPVMDVYHLERHGQEILYEHPKLRVPKRCSRTLVGTCDYIAPEILHTHLHTVMDIIDSDESQVADDDEYDAPGSYGPEVDWWSLGITLYELFYGRPPFYSPAVPATYEQIVSHDEHLRFPSTADFTPSTPVSRSAKDFISSLLSDPFERIGSGSTGISEIQSQSWFEYLDWSTLRTAESAFMPFCDPIELEEKTTGPREGDGGSGGAFNFSEFFHSSPGLSVLRSVRRRSDSIEEEELGHSRLTWEGFTLLPRDCEEFEREEEARVAISTSQKKLKSSLTASGQGRMMGLIDNGFVTPKRPGIRRGTMMTRTGVRGMTDLEEWKVLVDHVMMTAQKKKEEEQEDQKETGEDDDGFDELEGRASGLLEAVDVILKRYRDLLGLIEAG